MPSFAFLSDKERSGLISYIQTLGGEDLEPNSYQPLVPLEARSEEFGGVIKEGHGGMTEFLWISFGFLFIWTIYYFVVNWHQFLVLFA